MSKDKVIGFNKVKIAKELYNQIDNLLDYLYVKESFENFCSIDILLEVRQFNNKIFVYPPSVVIREHKDNCDKHHISVCQRYFENNEGSKNE